MFYYTDTGEYSRGVLMYFEYVMNYLYGFLCLLVIFMEKKKAHNNQFYGLLLATAFQIAASAIQYFSGNLLLEMLSCTCSLLTIQVFVEKPENYKEYNTKLFNSNAFSKLVDDKIESRKKFNVILIHVSNFNRLFSVFTRFDSITVIRKVSTKISSTAKEIDRTSHIYFLDHGTYAIIHSKFELTPKIIDALRNYLLSDVSLNGDVNFVFQSQICSASYPSDFTDKDSLINFSNSFYNLIDFKDDVVDITTYQNKDSINLLFALDKILEKAISEKSFEMYYQPIYSVKTKKFNSAEALIRLKNEKYGFIPPSIFIPYAEKIGKMNEIGDIILQKSLQFIGSKEFDDLNLEYIEINLSILQLHDKNIIDRINYLVNEYRVDKNKVNFELTESAAIADDKVVTQNISSLSNNGYKLSIDDFGTGYSNLVRLFKLPFSIIKLDKAIVDQFGSNSILTLMRTVTTLLNDNGFKIVSEGVENQKTLDWILDLDIDFVQGYYFSKPLPQNEFLEFIKNKNN